MFSNLSSSRPKTQLHIHSLPAKSLTIKATALAALEILHLCYEVYKDRPETLNTVQKLKQNYKSDEAISWYQKNIFLARFVNEALCDGDIEQVYLLRQFVSDLRVQLRFLKRERQELSIEVQGSRKNN